MRKLRTGSRAGTARVDVLPPLVLGTLAGIAGVAIEIVRPAQVMWPWITAAALAVGIGSVLASLAAVSTLAWALLTVGLWAGVSTLDWLTDERIWPTAVWVGLLLIVTAFLPGRHRNGAWLQRWDLPPFVVAHAAAAAVIVAAAVIGDMPATWSLLGALSAAVAAVLRRWPWAAGSAALLIGASLAAGDGWPTVTLLGLSVASLGLAVIQPQPARGILNAIAAALALAGWGAAIDWQGWWPDPALAATAVGAGIVAVGLSMALRENWVAQRTVIPWAVAALLAELSSVAALPVGERGPAGVGLSIGLGLWALSLGVLAQRTGIRSLRELAVVPALGSGLALLYSQQPAAKTVALTAAGAGMLVGVVGVWMKTTRDSDWSRPVFIGSAAADVVAGIAGLSLLPDVESIVIVLVAIGVKLLAISVVTRSPAAGAGALWSLIGAWLLFATEAATGNPQWFAIPVGVGLAATSDLIRWYLRSRETSGLNLLPVDVVAAVLIVGPSLVQTVTRSVGYGLLVMTLGALLVGWGVATRMRRRLAIGAAATAAGAVMLIIVPLARIVPQFRGPALWASVIVLGMALIGAAVAIERGRSQLRLTIGRLRDLTADWEA